jgi:hypothetical protein
MSADLLKRLDKKLAWLRDSGIQAPPGAPDAGGVFAWIDESTGAPAYVYSEITGYFMSLAVHVARWRPHEDWLARAERAGEWIVGTAMDERGAVLARKYADPAASAADPYSFDNRRVLFFDCAMVGFGLTNLYEATGRAAWLDAATRVGRFVQRAFESADQRTRHPIFDLKTGAAPPPEPRWSRHFGSYELKGAMFLDSLARHTGDASFRAMSDRILADALASQQPSGRFPTHLPAAATHLHPHCYTIEGLQWLLARRDDAALRAPVRRAIEWMFTTCLLPADGRQLHQWSEEPQLVFAGMRNDALAQALRTVEVASWLDPAFAPPWRDALPALQAQLDGATLPSGGTVYGVDEMGPKPRHANAWVHFFSTELDLLRAQRLEGRLEKSTLIIT